MRGDVLIIRGQREKPQSAPGPQVLGTVQSAVKSAASHGVVAQLGERRVRNAKVEGSIPFHSTRIPPGSPAG
jgi:hypothetical protein